MDNLVNIILMYSTISMIEYNYTILRKNNGTISSLSPVTEANFVSFNWKLFTVMWVFFTSYLRTFMTLHAVPIHWVKQMRICSGKESDFYISWTSLYRHLCKVCMSTIMGHRKAQGTMVNTAYHVTFLPITFS